MSSPSTLPAPPPLDPAEQSLRDLRGLLLGPELQLIESLRQRLDDPDLHSQHISNVLAEAIALRAKQDHKLQANLQPLIEEALRISVARDPAMLATALFPIIGDAVRKAVGHALQGMFDSLNQMLDRGLSFESWMWRFEAWRSGKSYGEIALTRSLKYRVEQVFLIHRETGLLLAHLTSSQAVVQDADMVSGMLTAIQDFVRDSFSTAQADELEVMQVGQFKLWLQHGPLALLAAVVSGQPPTELRQVFERELEAIHRDFTPQLRDFQGDSADLAPADPYLRRCLLGAAPATRVKKSYRAVWIITAVLLLLIAAFTAVRIRDTRRWEHYVAGLQSRPGLVVISSRRLWTGYALIGMRDPLAIDPATLLPAARVPAAKVHAKWQPFLSLDPRFAAARRLEEVRVAVEKSVLRFDLNSDQLPVDQFLTLETIQDELSTLRRAADTAGASLTVEISGHTDHLGKETHNLELSQARANTVVLALVSRGIPAYMLKASGMADRAPQHPVTETYPDELDRRVTFHVITSGGLAPATQGPSDEDPQP